MGKPDRRRIVKHAPNTRTRRPRLVADVDQTAKQLDAQLRSMGLRVSPTEGDGNCLFRALSDQLYGSDAQHAILRRDVCDWLAMHPDRFRGFVDDDRSLEDHIRNMRELGTYGGHLELSAFAERFHRDVKVVQPGLIYVISCGTVSPSSSRPSPSSITSVDDREARRLRRESIKQAAEEAQADEGTRGLPVYVAYHDWEHYSSLRNIDGPYNGPPTIRDISVPVSPDPEPTPTPVIPRPRGRPRKNPPPHRVPWPPSPLGSKAYRDPSPSHSASTSAASTSGSATTASTPPTSNSPKRSASEMSDNDEPDEEKHRTRKLRKGLPPARDAVAEAEEEMKKKLSRKERRAVGRVGGSRVLVRQRPKTKDIGITQRTRASFNGDIAFKELVI